MYLVFIFVSSFVVLIGLGMLLLFLLQFVKVEIFLVDVLFMAISVVCVIGLIVLIMGEDFILIGQVFILVFLQLGGLGMLMFINVFGLFFCSFGFFCNWLMLQDMINSCIIEGIKGLLVCILVFIFVVEGIGVLFIYSGLVIGSVLDGNWAWFVIFYVIFVFCNVGFFILF